MMLLLSDLGCRNTLTVIIIFEFYMKLCILMQSHETIIIIPIFQYTFDHSMTPYPHINNHLMSPNCPLNIHSMCPECPFNDPSTRHHKTVLTTACFQHIGYICQSLLRANSMLQWGVIISCLQYILEFVNNSDTLFPVSHIKKVMNK